VACLSLGAIILELEKKFKMCHEKFSNRYWWSLFGGVLSGVGWLAFVQGIIIVRAGNITDPSNMLTLAPIFGAIVFAFLFSFRYAQISADNGGGKIAHWRKVSLLVLGCGILTLAIVRIYSVFWGGHDVVVTVVLSLSWIGIGGLIGWFIGNKETFESLLRK
jgi:hypothetical protein